MPGIKGHTHPILGTLEVPILCVHRIHHLSIQPFLLGPAPLPQGIQLSLQLGPAILCPSHQAQDTNP